MELDIHFDIISGALRDFGGIQRRFQVKAEKNRIMVVDDYAHHPSEIRSTLKAAKNGWNRRIVAVFQPHRYTRTRDLYNDFVTAFNEADILVLTDISPAGEKAIEGISGRKLFEEIQGMDTGMFPMLKTGL